MYLLGFNEFCKKHSIPNSPVEIKQNSLSKLKEYFALLDSSGTFPKELNNYFTFPPAVDTTINGVIKNHSITETLGPTVKYSKGAVPKVVHIIWFGQCIKNWKSIHNILSWKKQNPGYQVILWCDFVSTKDKEAVGKSEEGLYRALSENNIALVNCYESLSGDSDFELIKNVMIHYWIMCEFGKSSDLFREFLKLKFQGIYADHDITCLAPLGKIVLGKNKIASIPINDNFANDLFFCSVLDIKEKQNARNWVKRLANIGITHKLLDVPERYYNCSPGEYLWTNAQVTMGLLMHARKNYTGRIIPKEQTNKPITYSISRESMSTWIHERAFFLNQVKAYPGMLPAIILYRVLDQLYRYPEYLCLDIYADVDDWHSIGNQIIDLIPTKFKQHTQQLKVARIAGLQLTELSKNHLRNIKIKGNKLLKTNDNDISIEKNVKHSQLINDVAIHGKRDARYTTICSFPFGKILAAENWQATLEQCFNEYMHISYSEQASVSRLEKFSDFIYSLLSRYAKQAASVCTRLHFEKNETELEKIQELSFNLLELGFKALMEGEKEITKKIAIYKDTLYELIGNAHSVFGPYKNKALQIFGQHVFLVIDSLEENDGLEYLELKSEILFLLKRIENLMDTSEILEKVLHQEYAVFENIMTKLSVEPMLTIEAAKNILQKIIAVNTLRDSNNFSLLERICKAENRNSNTILALIDIVFPRGNFKNDIYENLSQCLDEKECDKVIFLTLAKEFQKKNNLDYIQEILQCVVNTQMSDTQRNTLLHHACACNNLEVAKCLIEYKVDVNALNNNNVSGLLMARHHKNDKLVNLLISNGAKDNNKNYFPSLLMATGLVTVGFLAVKTYMAEDKTQKRELEPENVGAVNILN